mmetsp:Transcript_13688/g.25940  ORF Transcript_13688/g.25940 Transcript_13688/m.25940 type:complete len:916 (-) Transcript_13688:38-2785(-)
MSMLSGVRLVAARVLVIWTFLDGLPADGLPTSHKEIVRTKPKQSGGSQKQPAGSLEVAASEGVAVPIANDEDYQIDAVDSDNDDDLTNNQEVSHTPAAASSTRLKRQKQQDEQIREFLHLASSHRQQQDRNSRNESDLHSPWPVPKNGSHNKGIKDIGKALQKLAMRRARLREQSKKLGTQGEVMFQHQQNQIPGQQKANAPIHIQLHFHRYAPSLVEECDKQGVQIGGAQGARKVDLVLSFTQDHSQSNSTLNQLWNFKKHKLLKVVQRVYVLIGEDALADLHGTGTLPEVMDGAEIHLVHDKDIGVVNHQKSTQFSALANIPGISEWFLYVPSDLILVRPFVLEDFYDFYSNKPRMYSYDANLGTASSTWCDGGRSAGSFSGPVLVNKCLLDAVARRYTKQSTRYNWTQNQIVDMGIYNLDSVCLYTKSVLDEGIAMDGMYPSWFSQCMMNAPDVTLHDRCTLDDLVALAEQSDNAKLMRDSRLKFLKLQGSLISKESKCPSCDASKAKHFYEMMSNVSTLSDEGADVPAGDFLEDDALAHASASSNSESEGESSSRVLILVIVLFIAALLSLRRNRLAGTGHRAAVAVCLLLYVICVVLADAVAWNQISDRAHPLRPVVLVFVTELVKLLASAASVAADVQQNGSSKAAISAWPFLDMMGLMVLPGLCYTVLDIGRLMVLPGSGIVQYHVGRSLEIAFVCPVWFATFRKMAKANEVLGLMLVFLASGFLLQPQAVSGYLMVGLACISALGLVINDLILKASPDVPLAVQNCALYAVTCTLSGTYAISTVPAKELFLGFGLTSVPLVLLGAVAGLSLSFILKHKDAVATQFAGAWLVPISALWDHFARGTRVQPLMAASALLCAAGTLLHQLDAARDLQSEVWLARGKLPLPMPPSAAWAGHDACKSATGADM